MARIRLYSHSPSDTINRLKSALEAVGHNVKKLRTVGGTYRGRESDFVFNYGSSSLPNTTIGQAICLNDPADILRASNKRSAFATMEQASVRTVEYTTTRSVAETWVREGALVYVRSQLQGHSGEGISLVHQNPNTVGDAGGFVVSDTVPNAQLYTKGILGNRREYRVHVFGGKIIHVAQKRRRDGFNEIPDHSNLVRNHHTGWVYSTQNMTALNHAGKCEALKAMASLGLDFGAVDIITNREDAYVLEVNTAPGMEGVTLEKYVAAISQHTAGVSVEGETIPGFADFRQSTGATPNARPANTTQPSNNTSATTPPAQPQSRTETAPTQEQTRAAAPGRSASRTTLTNGSFYFLSVAGEETVGKYNRNTNDFEIVGWEPHVEASEVTVIAPAIRG